MQGGIRTYLRTNYFSTLRPDGVVDWEAQMCTLVHEAYHSATGDFDENVAYNYAAQKMEQLRRAGVLDGYHDMVEKGE